MLRSDIPPYCILTIVIFLLLLYAFIGLETHARVTGPRLCYQCSLDLFTFLSGSLAPCYHCLFESICPDWPLCRFVLPFFRTPCCLHPHSHSYMSQIHSDLFIRKDYTNRIYIWPPKGEFLSSAHRRSPTNQSEVTTLGR